MGVTFQMPVQRSALMGKGYWGKVVSQILNSPSSPPLWIQFKGEREDNIIILSTLVNDTFCRLCTRTQSSCQINSSFQGAVFLLLCLQPLSKNCTLVSNDERGKGIYRVAHGPSWPISGIVLTYIDSSPPMSCCPNRIVGPWLSDDKLVNENNFVHESDHPYKTWLWFQLDGSTYLHHPRIPLAVWADGGELYNCSSIDFPRRAPHSE